MLIQEIMVREYFADTGNLATFNALMEANRLEAEGGCYAQAVEPKWEAYAALQDAGRLIVLGVFEDDHAVPGCYERCDAGCNGQCRRNGNRQLVGYGCAVVTPSLHYAHLVAVSDVIFVLPAYRKKGYGLYLMREMECRAKGMGAQFMVWQAKTGSSLNKVLLRRGCRAEETVYTKRL